MSADRSPYLFQRYMSRKQYLDAKGIEAPPFDATRKIKNWEDPAASSKFARIVYPYTIEQDEDGQPLRDNGAPVLMPLVISVAEAQTVNLPPEDEHGNTSIQSEWLPAVPCPITPPGPGEALVFGDTPFTGNAVWLRNLAQHAAEQAAQEQEAGRYTTADRQQAAANSARLEAMEKKLNAIALKVGA